MDRETPPGKSIYHLIYYKATRNRLRYIIPAALLMFGGLASASWRESWGSTYICPTDLGQNSRIPVMQTLCVALDVFLVIIAGELSHKEHRIYDGQEKHLTVLLGYIYLVCIYIISFMKQIANRTYFKQGVALFWILVGFLVFIVHAEQREWMLSLEPSFKRSVLMQSLLFTLLTATAAKTVSFRNSSFNVGY